MFTANPVTGKRDQIVIDASPGLGEAVVSGGGTEDVAVGDNTDPCITDRSTRSPPSATRCGSTTARRRTSSGRSTPAVSRT
ncbi:pyruvate, water dikinase [Lentzea xinjiangensis]|uniref:Pyruvate, water dikinase n=1 Tax=Lentzea xinjiangensis TaxID=402600 RepID=A0A1H9I587_9PSEU|nr:pyruvate, water dikinase [Lentzea xinjiangensis]